MKKELSMRIQDWETTLKEIVDECKHEDKERSGNKILLKWRAKLEKEPHLLQPFQIDEIIREVRRRLGSQLSR